LDLDVNLTRSGRISNLGIGTLGTAKMRGMDADRPVLLTTWALNVACGSNGYISEAADFNPSFALTSSVNLAEKIDSPIITGQRAR
jgi:hypothetical protein